MMIRKKKCRYTFYFITLSTTKKVIQQNKLIRMDTDKELYEQIGTSDKLIRQFLEEIIMTIVHVMYSYITILSSSKNMADNY